MEPGSRQRQNLLATNYAGKLYLFARGTDNKIYANVFNAAKGTWSLWYQVPGNGLTYAGPAASTYANNVFLYVQGTDNKIYVNTFHD